MRLIDADALKRLVAEEWFDCQEKTSFFDEIDRAPTIDPVKHAEWAYREKRDYPIAFDRVGCPNCGWRFYSHPDEREDEHRADYIARNYKFCPMCGATMRRSAEGEH